MPKLRPEELSKLYPVPKSFEEIESGRKARMLARRPKYASVRLSIYSTLVLLILIAAYSALTYIFTGTLVSTGDGMFRAGSLILIGLITVAVIYYLYLLIHEVSVALIGSFSEAMKPLLVVFFFSATVLTLLAQWGFYGIFGVIFVLFFHAIASWVGARYISRSAINS